MASPIVTPRPAVAASVATPAWLTDPATLSPGGTTASVHHIHHHHIHQEDRPQHSRRSSLASQTPGQPQQANPSIPNIYVINTPAAFTPSALPDQSSQRRQQARQRVPSCTPPPAPTPPMQPLPPVFLPTGGVFTPAASAAPQLARTGSQSIFIPTQPQPQTPVIVQTPQLNPNHNQDFRNFASWTNQPLSAVTPATTSVPVPAWAPSSAPVPVAALPQAPTMVAQQVASPQWIPWNQFNLASFATPAWPPMVTLLTPGPVPQPPQIHPFLAPNPNYRNWASLQWDITRSPHTAHRLTQRGVTVPARSLYLEEALFPNTVTSLRVLVEPYEPFGQWTRQFWGGEFSITCQNNQALTIGNILYSIHQWFATPLTKPEYKRMTRGGKNIEVLKVAAYRRLAKADQPFEMGRREGYKRVDLLGDRTIFNGLALKQDVAGSYCYAVLTLTSAAMQRDGFARC